MVENGFGSLNVQKILNLVYFPATVTQKISDCTMRSFLLSRLLWHKWLHIMFTTKDVWKWFDFVPSFLKTSLGVYLDSGLFKLQVFTEIERFPSDTPCQTFCKWQSCKWYELTIFVVSWSPVITDRDRRRWICWEGDWIGILIWLEKDVEFRIVEDGTCHMSEIFQKQTLTQRIILHSLMGGPKHPKPTTSAPSTRRFGKVSALMTASVSCMLFQCIRLSRLKSRFMITSDSLHSVDTNCLG